MIISETGCWLFDRLDSTGRMSSEPYLVAHVVCGEPAFDIAIRCDDMGTESDPGPWWIIPTSGHRAYPYWSASLKDTYTRYDAQCEGNNVLEAMEGEFGHNTKLTDAVPDHYQATAAKGQGRIRNLDEVLGLLPKATIRRR